MLIEFLAVILCWVLLCAYIELEIKTYPMAVKILKMYTFCVKGVEFSMIIKLTRVKSQAY